MGCSESKINNVTILNQCKQRKAFMKQSVSAYAAFVSAHFAYAAALNNTGSALCDYAQSDLQSPDHHPHPENNGILAWDFFITLMEHATDSGIEIQRKVVKNHGDGDGGTGGVVKSGKGQLPPSMENVNSVKVFKELGDGFIKASESAYKALKVHEANKLLCHSSFADNQGQIKHSIKVVRVLKGGKVDSSSKEKETHATLLEKMLAWEKKLYDQVKAGEKIKHEYQKKMASLNKQRKRGASSDRLKQTEATVNRLHAALTVEMQSIDSTVSEINRLRDQHLYPKLVQIVEKMGEMWNNIRKQHEQQSTIVQRLINNNIKISQLQNDKNFEQIHLQVTIWCSEFENLILHQKYYIKSLKNWLKLNLISIHDNLKPQNPKITSLLSAWNDEIEKLPETRAKIAMKSLASVIVEIVQHQSHEMKLKETCEEIRREIEKKRREFEEWCDKEISKRVPSGEMDDMDVIAEQEVVVDALKRRLAEAEEECRRYRVEVVEKSVVKLTAALTEVFTAVIEYASGCLNMYGSLNSH